MASINSDGRNNQVNTGTLDLSGVYATYNRIKVYSDEATLTGVGINATVTFREGIPDGAIILTSLSVMEFDDLGTGGTVDLGYSGATTAFCSDVDTDTAAGSASFTESTTNPLYLKVTSSGFKPLLTRKTAAVTGSPKVRLTIVYIDPIAE